MIFLLFQRDLIQDLKYRRSWKITVIKSWPMLGLLGMVLGMMAAFDLMEEHYTGQTEFFMGARK